MTSAPLNICYLVNQYPKVSHTFIRREIQAIESMGHSVTRLSIRRSTDGLVDKLDIQEEAKTHYVLEQSTLVLCFKALLSAAKSPASFVCGFTTALKLGQASRAWLRAFIYLVEAYYVKKVCDENSVTHLHAHFGTNPAAVACLVKAIGGPSYSFTVHGPDEFDSAITYGLFQKISDAKFVVAITSFCKSQLFRWAKYDDWKKIKVVHCSIDGPILNENTKPIANTKTLINIGRLSEQKGQMLLLESMAQLRREGIGFQLKIVGDGELRPEMERYIDANNLRDHVSILGWLSGDQIQKELDDSTALVLPSFAEGLPVVIMEAYGRCRPVISTKIAGIPELVDETCGDLVTAGDVDSLAQSIKHLINSSLDELSAQGAEGRRRVELEHNALTEAEKIVTHIKEEIV